MQLVSMTQSDIARALGDQLQCCKGIDFYVLLACMCPLGTLIFGSMRQYKTMRSDQALAVLETCQALYQPCSKICIHRGYGIPERERDSDSDARIVGHGGISFMGKSCQSCRCSDLLANCRL